MTLLQTFTDKVRSIGTAPALAAALALAASPVAANDEGAPNDAETTLQQTNAAFESDIVIRERPATLGDLRRASINAREFAFNITIGRLVPVETAQRYGETIRSYVMEQTGYDKSRVVIIMERNSTDAGYSIAGLQNGRPIQNPISGDVAAPPSQARAFVNQGIADEREFRRRAAEADLAARL
ncbi:MAG: hypothetical protein AAGH53_13990 [Pseudomonadota bacterium]